MLTINDIQNFSEQRTPFYFYDMELLRRTVDKVEELSRKWGIHAHYAVKANVEERILRYVSSKGLGADCVSWNEAQRALETGFEAKKIVYAGVGKSDWEIEAGVKAEIAMFNCESLQEIQVINEIAARLGVRARFSARVNPGVDAHTHRYITTGTHENKFGIAPAEFDALIKVAKECEWLDFAGLHFHVGSQITDVEEVFRLTCGRANEIVEYFEARGLRVDNIDLGGGLGVDYDDPDGNPIPDFETWFETVAKNLKRRPDQQVHLEPGRSIVAQCGSLISRVLFVKNGQTKNFLILDAGMTDLIRPALYGAYHKIENLSAQVRSQKTADQAHNPESADQAVYGEIQHYDVVGPVCESSDVFGAGRELPPSQRGDLIAIRSAGAYGSVMSSNYNLRNTAPAVFKG